MSSKKDQHKAGLPPKPRGQQTGFAGNPDQNREAKKETPALRGRRKGANKMFADESSQQRVSDAATPNSNSPSVPAQEGGGHVGETGGEIAFKRRQGKKR
jgi:hypothetical protein